MHFFGKLSSEEHPTQQDWDPAAAFRDKNLRVARLSASLLPAKWIEAAMGWLLVESRQTTSS